MPIAEADPHLYHPPLAKPDDFESFWQTTLSQAREFDLDAVFEPAWMKAIEVYDVTFSGFGGQRVKAWLALPKGTTEPLPCIVEFPGYGGGRGLPHETLLYSASGYAHLFMDVRGQGSGWRSGETADLADNGEPQHPGFMTRGITSPEGYYYRRVITDAVRAVEAAHAHPLVSKVAVTGISQGGGLTLATAALATDVVAAAPDVPFLCAFRRGADIASTGPYPEIVNYLKVHRARPQQVFETLSYFDGVNFASMATVPALFSTALMDTTCPPSTVYAAYHYYAGPKDIAVYPFNGHEGGAADHVDTRLDFFEKVF